MKTETLAAQCRDDLFRRNTIFSAFFTAEAPRLARACQEMSDRFLKGGRLLAFGHGSAATDAQHVAVEFVHPVIVGKRALPALDLGSDFATRVPLLVRPDDMVLGFAFPAGDPEVERALQMAHARGALTFALAGATGDYAFAQPDPDPWLAQEIVEVLYHLLWETVHVYFEHREQGHDVGATSFLYPFLGSQAQSLEAVVTAVQDSMLQKVAELNNIRTRTAETETEHIAALAVAMHERIARGGTLIAFGNGGSATDANDMVADCMDPALGCKPFPAISLAAEPATLTAIANDIGAEAMFARQLIAHGRPTDVAIGISTSGSSASILTALVEARKRGMLTAALTGYDGGKIVRERVADHAIVVRSDHIPRIQEAQASVYHLLRGMIGQLMEGGDGGA